MLLPCATLTPEAEKLSSLKTSCLLSALWLKKHSVTLLQGSQSSTTTITTVCPPRPCLHSAAPSSPSHRTGCTVSKVRFSFTIWFELVYCFESLGGDEAVVSCHFMWFIFLKGSFTNVYLTIKRPLSNTATLNRIQDDLEHWPVSETFGVTCSVSYSFLLIT